MAFRHECRIIKTDNAVGSNGGIELLMGKKGEAIKAAIRRAALSLFVEKGFKDVMMKLKILGSGGMFPIPNPFCKCPICEEARHKRGRYQRLGPNLYIEDIQMLIDTPEDIAIACDRQGISEIRYLSISHKDPDHTRGMRIVEPLGYDCIADKGTPIPFICAA